MAAGFLIFAFISSVYLVFLTLQFLKLKGHYNRLIAVSGSENLTEILETVIKQLSGNYKEVDLLKKKLDNLALTGNSHIQRVGIVRYNPFTDTGGDQSFIMAILDGNDNGVILTSLHSRNATRWYAKNVRRGQGVAVKLSKEEEKAVKFAATGEKN